MGSHSATCHLAAVTFQPLPQPKLVLNFVPPEGCKAELIWVVVISQDSLHAQDSHLSQQPAMLTDIVNHGYYNIDCTVNRQTPT